MKTTSSPDRAQAGTPPRMTWTKRIFFWGVLLVISFIILEVGLRGIFAFHMGPRILLYGTSYYRRAVQPPPPKETVSEHANEQEGYTKYFPNEAKYDQNPETGESFSVTINSQGFRGKDFVPQKAENVTRIITLGASSTFGFFDKDDETYPYYLEQRLNEIAEGGRTFEVLNMGIPHLRTEQILSLFRAEGLPLNPDIVTFYEGINDASAVNNVRGTLAQVSWLRSVFLETRDRVFTLAFADSFMHDGAVSYGERELEAHMAGRSERFLANIEAMLEECRSRNILFVVALQQARGMTIKDIDGLTYAEEAEITRQKLANGERITYNELAFLAHQKLTTDLKAWAIEHDVPYVDVIGALDQNRNVLLSWVHLNPRGNQMIAQAMAEVISGAVKSRAE